MYLSCMNVVYNLFNCVGELMCCAAFEHSTGMKIAHLSHVCVCLIVYVFTCAFILCDSATLIAIVIMAVFFLTSVLQSVECHMVTADTIAFRLQRKIILATIQIDSQLELSILIHFQLLVKPQFSFVAILKMR